LQNFYTKINSVFYGLLLLYLVGCKSKEASSLQEGEIEFKLEVINNNNPLLTNDMLPSTMNFKFKDNNSVYSLNAFGVFSTDLISLQQDKKIIQTLKLMGKKYASVADSSQQKEFLKQEPAFEVQFTSKTKKIAGYNCKSAYCTYTNNSLPPFEVFYTEEIKILEPNFYSYYKPIKGVLLEFNVMRYNVEMRLTAQKIENVKIDETIFSLNNEFKIVSKKEMDGYFNMQ
jgi:hypothetical protein